MSTTKKKTKTQTQTASTLIYVGPTIPGVAFRNMIFTNGLTETLKSAMADEPALRSLVIPIDKLAAAQTDLSAKRGAIYAFYVKATKYNPTKGV